MDEARRPHCRCHNEPCDKVGPRWACAVKRRARQRKRYHANAARLNYIRYRRLLRARIERQRRQIMELEERLAQENTR